MGFMLDKFRYPAREENFVTVAPRTNIYQHDNELVLATEMPGIDKKTLSVVLEGNVLELKAKKKQNDVGKQYSALHLEREPAQYYRAFELNSDVDRDALRAEYKDGVLTVYLPKSKQAMPKKIEIQT